jgi:hypothetical protein
MVRDVADVDEKNFNPDFDMAAGEKAFTVTKERRAAERIRIVAV